MYRERAFSLPGTKILYGSCYGTAKRYAEALAKAAGFDCHPYTEAAEAADCDRLVYVGGLYAGGIHGLSKALHALHPNRERRYCIVTVGLADPKDTQNVQNIRAYMEKRLPREVMEKAEIFHLRGGIDYARLNFTHKTMMALLYNSVKRKPPESLDADARAMLETYGKKVDFVDLATLQPIIEALSRP